VTNVPVLRSQLDAATAATTAEDLWDDQQVTLVGAPITRQAASLPAERLRTLAHPLSKVKSETNSQISIYI